MAVQRFPAYLTLIHPRDRRVADSRRPEPAPRFDRFGGAERDPLCGVATREALLSRLEEMGDLAPSAPLSFVAIHLEGLEAVREASGPHREEQLLKAVARQAVSLSRSTDMTGRIGPATFAIVLQGTGATGAAAVAARLQHHLTRAIAPYSGARVVVAAATGTGLNALTLPAAALDAVAPAPA